MVEYAEYKGPYLPVMEGSGLHSVLPRLAAEGMDLLMTMLEYPPDSRVSAEQAMRHSYFDSFAGLPSP